MNIGGGWYMCSSSIDIDVRITKSCIDHQSIMKSYPISIMKLYLISIIIVSYSNNKIVPIPIVPIWNHSWNSRNQFVCADLAKSTIPWLSSCQLSEFWAWPNSGLDLYYSVKNYNLDIGFRVASGPHKNRRPRPISKRLTPLERAWLN